VALKQQYLDVWDDIIYQAIQLVHNSDHNPASPPLLSRPIPVTNHSFILSIHISTSPVAAATYNSLHRFAFKDFEICLKKYLPLFSNSLLIILVLV